MTSSLKRIVAVLLVFAMGIGIWYFAIRDNETIPTKLADSTEPAPDPRLAFQTIFRNVKPDVKYVGDARCAVRPFSAAKPNHSKNSTPSITIPCAQNRIRSRSRNAKAAFSTE
jgi:hypothetical protein